MSDTPAPTSSFTQTANDLLGAINNLGVTAANIRDRFSRQPQQPAVYAVPMPADPPHAGLGKINDDGNSVNWTMVGMLALGLLVVALGLRALKSD